jgi:hypothetical protein
MMGDMILQPEGLASGFYNLRSDLPQFQHSIFPHPFGMLLFMR